MLTQSYTGFFRLILQVHGGNNVPAAFFSETVKASTAIKFGTLTN